MKTISRFSNHIRASLTALLTLTILYSGITSGTAVTTAVSGNTVYVIVPGPSWAQAEAQAIALGGHLTTIGSREENDFLVMAFGQQPLSAFIGYTREGSPGEWHWIDGSSSTYTKWNDWDGLLWSEPNNWGGNETVAVIMLNNPEDGGRWTGRWNDIPTTGPSVGIAEITFASEDEDNDGVSNYREILDETNPRDPLLFNPSSRRITFDAVQDFGDQNPNGVWSYGYASSIDLGGSFTPYDVYTPSNSHLMWNTTTPIDTIPSVWKNISGTVMWDVPPGSLALHPGPHTLDETYPHYLYAVLRFTAPTAGTYHLSIHFGQGGFGDTDAWIIVNGDAGQPLFYEPTTDSNPSFESSLVLSKGDRLDIAVGPKGFSWGDNTPVVAVITSPMNPEADEDGDGVTNYREVKDKTSPTDSNSFDPMNVGLLAYLPFDGGTSDESGRSNHARNFGAALTGDRFDVTNSAYYFNGADSRLEIADNLNFRPSSFTVSAWVKGADYGQNRVILTKNAGNGPHESIGLQANNSVYNLMGTIGGPEYWGNWLQSPTSFESAVWKHVVCVFDDANNYHKLFIDGRNVVSGAEITSIVYDAHPWSIGAQLENGQWSWFFEGAIDDVRIYNRALPDSQIKQLFYQENFTEEERGFLGDEPSVMGHYSQTDYDLNRTNGQIDVTINPAAFNLFTQNEYEGFGALQFSNGVITVLSNPAAFNLFTHNEYESFGALQFSNGISSVISNPSTFNLFTQEQFNSNRLAGQSDVISNPMSYGLYTSNSIMDLRMDGLMIQRQGTNAVVSFQPQTTTDLTLPFTNNGTPITNTIPMPGNKGFIRINAKP
jgi:hypothetical protein